MVLGHKAKRSLVATIRGLTRHLACAAGGNAVEFGAPCWWPRFRPDREELQESVGARCTSTMLRIQRRMWAIMQVDTAPISCLIACEIRFEFRVSARMIPDTLAAAGQGFMTSRVPG